jgi:hypothetical protein
MFESKGRTMARHKQIVIATIAVSAMLLYAFPAGTQNLASASFDPEIENEPEFGDQDLAQRLVDETQQDIDQRAQQRQAQELDQRITQELTQSNEANIDQSEENAQSNTITTGDNTASGSNTVSGSSQAAEADARSGGSGSDGHSKKNDCCPGGDATAEAENTIEQDVDIAQDSSADDNTQTNVNEFGDDVAFVDQDNVGTQTATNVGVQRQDQDLNQYATNVDLTAQLGENTQEANLESTITCILEEGDRQGGGGADVCF